MVSTRPLFSKSSSLSTNPLVTIQIAQITIGITATFMFHSFFQFSFKVKKLSSLFTFFQFYPVVSRNGKVNNSADSIADVFHWSLSDSKSPQPSRTLLSILAVLNDAVVWMVSTRPLTSKSSSPFSNPLVTVPNAPITIGIIVTCMFHSFFSSLARSRFLSFFSHSFSFILWSAWIAKSTIL